MQESSFITTRISHILLSAFLSNLLQILNDIFIFEADYANLFLIQIGYKIYIQNDYKEIEQLIWKNTGLYTLKLKTIVNYL
jgi:hypothetical protein